MKIRLDSLAFRLVAGAGLWIIAVIIVGGLALSAIFQSTVERAFDQRLAAQIDTLIAAVRIHDNGNVSLTRTLNDKRYDVPYSGWYWQIHAPWGGVVLRSRSLWDRTLDPPTDMGERQGFYEKMESRKVVRRYAKKVFFPSFSSPMLFTITGDAKEIDAEIGQFNTMLFLFLGTVAVGLILAVLVQVYFGLRPLRQIERQLARVRFGEDDRLKGRFPVEISPMVSEINSLIDYNAALLDRARRHIGNLVHALRTPLTVLMNEAEQRKGPLGDVVRRQSTIMQRYIHHHLSRARSSGQSGLPGMRTLIGPVVNDIRRVLVKLYPQCRIDTKMPVADLCFRGERGDLEEMIGNIMENACKWAKSKVCLTTRWDRARLTITIEDDGPGLGAKERDKVFARGARLDEKVPGSGLGLSIVQDCVELYGGTVVLDDADLGGLRVTLTVPGVSAKPA